MSIKIALHGMDADVSSKRPIFFANYDMYAMFFLLTLLITNEFSQIFYRTLMLFVLLILCVLGH